MIGTCTPFSLIIALRQSYKMVIIEEAVQRAKCNGLVLQGTEPVWPPKSLSDTPRQFSVPATTAFSPRVDTGSACDNVIGRM